MKDWPHWTDKELADEAQTSLRGQCATVQILNALRQESMGLASPDRSYLRPFRALRRGRTTMFSEKSSRAPLLETSCQSETRSRGRLEVKKSSST